MNSQPISLDRTWTLTAGPQSATAPRNAGKLNVGGMAHHPRDHARADAELDLMAANRLPEL